MNSTTSQALTLCFAIATMRGCGIAHGPDGNYVICGLVESPFGGFCHTEGGLNMSLRFESQGGYLSVMLNGQEQAYLASGVFRR